MSTTALRPLLRTTHLTCRSPTHPASPLHRPQLLLTPTTTTPHTRSANLLRRPKRPWLNDQLVILSDGSAFTQLTTSPKGIVRSTKDVRNHPLWNPSVHKLMDVEEDEAGRLRAFRERFGRGWDTAGGEEEEEEGASVVDGEGELEAEGEGAEEKAETTPKREDNLVNLMREGYDAMVAAGPQGKVKRKKVDESAVPEPVVKDAGEKKKKK
ncbi:hypothetical protein DFH27DRAFT_650047 [Peziza echinospora]|nr:hypothetical protein DFH27DRAFT_650047 [Peziza echinospora]